MVILEVNLSRKMSKKQGTQLINWFFTYNNYLESDPIELKILFNKICKSYHFQKEVGKEGTRHLQGCISLIKKMRITELKKITCNAIHWEPTKNVDAAKLYCLKDESSTGERWSHEKTKLFKRTKSKFDSMEPRKEIMDIVTVEPDNRTINWVWSEEGGVGKTSTCAYLEHMHEGVCIANGKGNDIKNTVVKHLEENDLDVLIINVPRCNENYVSYAAIEEIKDGLIYSGKYEGGFANIEHPHVIVISNFYPEISKLSEDRWNIIELKKNQV